MTSGSILGVCAFVSVLVGWGFLMTMCTACWEIRILNARMIVPLGRQRWLAGVSSAVAVPYLQVAFVFRWLRAHELDILSLIANTAPETQIRRQVANALSRLVQATD